MTSAFDSTRAKTKLRRIVTGVDGGIKPAMQDSMNLLHREVIMRTPRNTGNLEDQITSYVSPTGLTGEVGLRGKRAKERGFYLRFLEFGTKGHTVSTSKKVLSDGDNTFGTNADIPRYSATPILSPAWDFTKPVIINKVTKAIDNSIKKAADI